MSLALPPNLQGRTATNAEGAASRDDVRRKLPLRPFVRPHFYWPLAAIMNVQTSRKITEYPMLAAVCTFKPFF
jgi:hypothetical protein